MRTMYADKYMTLKVDDLRQVASLTRSNAAYASIDELVSSCRALADALGNHGSLVHGLLFDVRLAPLRNDEEFDRVSKRELDGVLLRFRKVAVLVATATGKLQIHRIKREHGLTIIEAFDDEPKAMTFAMAAPAS